MSNHDKAIEAACKRAWPESWFSAPAHQPLKTIRMRRAVADFLRAEATQLLAAYKARSIGGMLADELNSLAAELESDNA